MQINIAAWKAADAIHAGDVIAKSSIGMHENRMGLFMEAAPGKTARKFLSALPELQLSMSTDAFKAFRGNLMRELSKLEWADMLSGQADRHSENYLVDVDPDTGRVKITGIDNDASFGARRVGMTKIDVSDKPELQQRLGLEPPPAGTNAPVVVNAHNYHGRQFAAFREAFGFNQLFRPTHIDRETFDALININTIEYGNQMRQCMDEGAAQAALLRLADAQTWARELEKHGRVISGDEWRSNARAEELKTELQTVISGFPPGATRQEQALEAQLRLGFFARDFRMLL